MYLLPDNVWCTNLLLGEGEDWPWSIKPSLAVMWGVRWLFYNYIQASGSSGDNDSSDSYQNVGVPQRRFIQDEGAAQWVGWESPQPSEYELRSSKSPFRQYNSCG